MKRKILPVYRLRKEAREKKKKDKDESGRGLTKFEELILKSMFREIKK